jgi:hypothetical protein
MNRRKILRDKEEKSEVKTALPQGCFFHHLAITFEVMLSLLPPWNYNTTKAQKSP